MYMRQDKGMEISDGAARFAGGAEERLRPQKSRLKRREHWTALAFISVKYVGLIVFTLLPVVVALLYSFTDYSSLDTMDSFFVQIDDLWVGFANYGNLFTNMVYNEAFLNAIVNNLIFLISVPLGILLGLIIAYILSREKKIVGSRVIRLLIYVPVVSSAVATGIIWRYIFDNEMGIVNQIFGTVIQWMTDPFWLKVAVIVKSVWGAIGGTMILCLAGLTNISRDYYEAAELDGAGELSKFFRISLPLVSPTLFYLLCTGFIGNLQSYVDAQVFAEGNPGAQTIVYFIWNYGINSGLYGVASAASFLLAIGIMLFTMLQFRISDKWVYSE